MNDRRSQSHRLEVIFSELQLAVNDIQTSFGRPISHLVFLDQLPQRRATDAGKVSLALPQDLSQWGRICSDLANQTAGRESLCEIAISHIAQLRDFLLERTEQGNPNVDLDPRLLRTNLENVASNASTTCANLLCALDSLSGGDVPMHDLQDPGTEERMISDAIHIAKHNPAILAGWDVSELEAIIEHVIALQKLLRITLQATNTALCLLGDETLPAQATLDIEMRRTIHKSTNTKFKLPENAYHALYIFLPVIALVSIMVLIGKK